MKSPFLAAVALAFAAAPAWSADLAPAPVAYKAPLPVVSIYNWTGFYIGAHGGYSWGKTIDTTNPGTSQREPDGGFGGIQVGYNWQPVGSPWVLGLEADVSFSDIKDSWGGATQFDPYYGKDGLGTFGTVRGRVGYAFDNVLIYGTGGLAWGENKHGFGCDGDRVAITLGCQYRRGGQAFYVDNTDTRIGWTVGAGLEVAFWRHWSAKAEYAYTDYGTNTIYMVDPNYPAARAARNFDGTYHTVKFGVNYHFN